MLWDIAEAIWDWATDNRKRAIRFFGTLGVVGFAVAGADVGVATRPVAPESLCDTVSALESTLEVSFGSSTNNDVFDGLGDVASQSSRLSDDAPGAVAAVHAAAPALEALADRESIYYDEVANALYPVQAYCAELSVAAAGQPAPAAAPADDGGSGSQATADAPSSSPVQTTAAPTASPEEEALLQLAAARSDSLADLVFDERWIAQVASKYVGITDPLQTAANGTHTFYAVDILAEVRAAEAAAGSAPVLVLQSTDFGRISYAPNGEPYWITLVDGGFAGADAIVAWCANAFPQLNAEQLANACAARTMTAPHA